MFSKLSEFAYITFDDLQAFVKENQRVLVTSTVGVVVILYTYQQCKRQQRIRQTKARIAEKLERISAKKRDLANKLRTTDQVVLEKRKQIIKLGVREIADAVKNGKYTATEVLQAFQARALEATDLTNCITEFLDEANGIAEELDLNPPENPGPLFGVPFTIKESINVKGYDSTAGMSKFINKPADEDAIIIKILRENGAIPFAKTNVPQCLYSFGCSNPVYGTTCHPTHPDRTPGGSSGGEGATLALSASPLGLGSDLGGSIRVPSHFCGLVGLKPTSKRQSLIGHMMIVTGLTGVFPVMHFMGRWVDDVVLATKLYCEPSLYEMDPLLPPMPFNNKIYEETRPLRIGYYDFDGYILPAPSCRRAVAMAKEQLEKAGHELVPYQPPGTGEHIFYLAWGCASGDDQQALLKDFFGGEQFIDPCIAPFVKYYSMSRWRRRLSQWLTSWKWPKFGRHMGMRIGPRTTYDFQRLIGERDMYVYETIATWKQLGLDAVISPAFTTPSYPLGEEHNAFLGCPYTMLYNVLDFPSGCVPVTRVSEQDELMLLNHPENDFMDITVKKHAKNTVGLPVGVLVSSLPYKEEICLRLMTEIEGRVHFQL